MEFRKPPPQSIEIEEAVLGAIIIESYAMLQVVDVIKNENIFYKETHQLIYKTCLELFQKSEPIDLLTVTNQLRNAGKLDMVGGAYYITELTAKVNSSTNLVFHSRILVELSLKREIIKTCSDFVGRCYDDKSDSFKLIDDLESELFVKRDVVTTGSTLRVDSITKSVYESLVDRKLQSEQGKTSGLNTGFSRLNEVTGGWQKTDLVIIGARPAMGKTSFLISAFKNLSVDEGIPSAIFSLEMSKEQLVEKLISNTISFDSNKMRSGKMSQLELNNIASAITDKINKSPLFIDDTPALSINEIRAKSKKLVKNEGVKIIGVDYLQLMRGTGKGNREQEIASISRGLKQIAKECDVPVIALSQLSRSVETRGGDKRPNLSDLRESGAIEQDGDIIGFLYRPEYYGIFEDDEGNNLCGLGELIIEKNRHGQLEDILLKFKGQYSSYTDKVTPVVQEPQNNGIKYDKGNIDEFGKTPF